jgi:hypothetical protein
MRVLEERRAERQWYFEVRLTDAKRDLPVEALLPCRMIHQFGEAGLYIPVAPEYMALILDVGAVRHLMNVVVVERHGHLARWQEVVGGIGYFHMPAAGAAVADTDYAVVVGVVEEVDRFAVCTWVDPVVTWDTSMDQLAEPWEVGIVAEGKVCTHSAGLEGRIGSRIRRADIVEEACTADAGIAAVAVLASVGPSTPVGHLGCDRITRQLVKACLASRLAFLFISKYQI